jgi:serine/threonine protein kinase/Tol biopolymer transport system component
MVITCPDREQLSGYVRGLLPEAGFEEIAEHVEQCPACESVVASLERTPDSVIEVLRQPAADDPVLAESACQQAVEQILALANESAIVAESTTSGVGTPVLAAAKVCLDFLSPAQQPDELGRLGTYRILKQLGGGGMGMVFLAEDLYLHRQVALKVMHPATAAKRGARERFLREAQAAATLEHEHIVTIFQVGEAGEIPFLAMQLLKGMSLEDRLQQAERSGPQQLLPIADVVRLGRQMARGLLAAHAKGLVHRDIKPANLWLEPEPGGRIKILDFGLAYPVEDEAHLTQSGAVVGTPSYMAPEQARGEKVDARCDLFSLGVVLYRMCSGRLPFTGRATMAVLASLATETPRPVAELNPRVPPGLEQLIQRLLAKERTERAATAAEVIAAFDAIERGPGATEVQPAAKARPAVPAREKVVEVSPRRGVSGRRRLLAVAAVLVVLLGGGLLAQQVLSRMGGESGETNLVAGGGGDEKNQDNRDSPGKQEGTTENKCKPMDPAALVSQPKAIEGLYSWNIEANESNAYVPRLTFTSDSRIVLDIQPFNARSSSAHLDLATGKWIAMPKTAAGVLSPDGKTEARVAGSASNTVELYEVGAVKPFFSLRGFSYRVEPIAWSPDSKFLAAVENVGNTNNSNLWLWDMATRKVVDTRKFDHGISSLQWLPDGKKLAILQLWIRGGGGGYETLIQIIDVKRGKKIKDFPASASDIVSPFWSWSPDCKLLVLSSIEARTDDCLTVHVWRTDSGKLLYTWKADAEGPLRLWSNVVFSADGKQLAYAAKDHTVRILDLETDKETHVLKGHTGTIVHLAFTPDGKTLASSSLDKTVRFWDASTGKQRASLVLLGSEDWLAITPEGYYRGSAGVEKYLQFVVQKEEGGAKTELSPTEFAKQYNWKNDSKKVRLFDK